MKAILFIALLAVSALAFVEKDYQQTFTKWMQEHKKSYHHDEFQYRYRIFKSNMDFVAQWNANPKNTHKVALNMFADLHNKEFSKLHLGFKKIKAEKPEYKPSMVGAVEGLPASKDWNKLGYVTPIKNQGQCGSCWSFSTTGSVEGCHKLGTGKLVSLSEQNLMDCSYPQGNQGCDGGLMTGAMQYIISNGGIDTEASYPYTAEDGSSCNYSPANRGSTLGGMINVTSGDEGDLQQKVNMGPVSIAIDASQTSFQLYSSGVYSDPNCSSQALDHGVLAVGWGVDSGSAFWLVKNSWGTGWGMNGFIEMARNSNNMCGVATMATLPIKCT